MGVKDNGESAMDRAIKNPFSRVDSTRKAVEIPIESGV
jgi:hypothetical protein